MKKTIYAVEEDDNGFVIKSYKVLKKHYYKNTKGEDSVEYFVVDSPEYMGGLFFYDKNYPLTKGKLIGNKNVYSSYQDAQKRFNVLLDHKIRVEVSDLNKKIDKHSQ